jgi:hypothetical protein
MEISSKYKFKHCDFLGLSNCTGAKGTLDGEFIVGLTQFLAIKKKSFISLKTFIFIPVEQPHFIALNLSPFRKRKLGGKFIYGYTNQN